MKYALMNSTQTNSEIQPSKRIFVVNDTVIGLASTAFAGVAVRVAQTVTEPAASSMGIVEGTEMAAPGGR